MTAIIYQLAVNLDCQQRVYDEIMTCFRDNTDTHDTDTNTTITIGDQLFDWQSLARLDYLDAFICETFRLHLNFDRDGRVANQDYTDETTGVTIEKDRSIFFSRSALHSSTDYYRQPDQFIPDRFLKSNRHQLVDSGAFLVFGFGRRMCPAYKFAPMVLKLTVAQLLVGYKFLPPIDGQTTVEWKVDPIFQHYVYAPNDFFY
ncbi:cytochrome P450 3A19-like [Oppia nitens]|uniref:cytochrome P450 3A19-like n=1 Tax=Oppia nitens TaxID=1686743 RepID=UPI0023DB655D|nr:cytochrome P450 3A19-like [Oppia nitens]